MTVLRPVKLDDLPAVQHLASLTGYGLTTLPRDEKFLRRRIRRSERSFEEMAEEDPPGDQQYLFVLEDVCNGEVVGASAIFAKVGGYEPFYAYELETKVHESTILNVRKEIQTLHLVEEHNGPTEIGSLFLAPEHRKEGNGRLLSLGRFLFLAEHPTYFDPMIIAEMRGVVDDTGRSPFWEAVGRHFFQVDYPTVDYLSMINKQVIAELMPRHPIYVPMLPPEAQAVIMQVHPETRPALKLLEEQGFETFGQLDIFEAGPMVRCALKGISTVQQSDKRPVVKLSKSVGGGDFHVSTSGRDFRAIKTSIEVTDQGVVISELAAQALGVEVGQMVRYAPVRARASSV